MSKAEFTPGNWQQTIDVRDFIQSNVRPYDGDDAFLAGPTARTTALNTKYERLKRLEQELGGVIDIDTTTVSSLLNYSPGYLDKDQELIVGLQTNRPLKRGVNPFGGIRMAEQACEGYGFELSPKVLEHFQYRTTHNDGVFRVYTPEMRAVRRSGVITGLPDAYGRGRIIGDYRRVPLYGVDALIKQKEADKLALGQGNMDEETIRLSEEVYRHIDFLGKLKEMAAAYGYDIAGPARTAREATQWLYFAYLAAIKEQNGAAMSLGRVSSFLDIYFERDIAAGELDESGAQEIIDDFVLKLRMARQLRTPDYNELFAGDPMWITEAIGGMGIDGRTLVTKSSYRFLNTLRTLGAAPEPNLTVLWAEKLPAPFKDFCAKLSIETDSLQYENDDLMRERFGDDYAIACCVSAAAIGKQMQFFGARVLDFDDVRRRYQRYLEWLSRLYVNTMNVIHFMHDKYAYEKIQMALHDTQVERFMSFGAAGLSVTTDSFSAIKYARVTPIKDERGLVTDFKTEGDFPAYGNDDDRADSIARELCDELIGELRKTPTYRGAEHTLSILTITSNVVYGKKTGSTPDGRKKGEPFAPGANPMHRRDKCGALASLNSTAKLCYDSCRDGISNTFSIVPETLGRELKDQQDNLVALLNGYFSQKAHHLNVNVLNREKLIDAMDNPEKYPNLTIRVSGYAVNFSALSRKQQEEVISRTYHKQL